MTVYVIFNSLEEMVQICKDIPTAFVWVDGAVEGSYRVSRGEEAVYVHTENGTYTIMEWHVLE